MRPASRSPRLSHSIFDRRRSVARNRAPAAWPIGAAGSPLQPAGHGDRSVRRRDDSDRRARLHARGGTQRDDHRDRGDRGSDRRTDRRTMGGAPRRPGLARATALAVAAAASLLLISGMAPASAAAGWRQPIRLAPTSNLDVFGTQLAFG